MARIIWLLQRGVCSDWLKLFVKPGFSWAWKRALTQGWHQFSCLNVPDMRRFFLEPGSYLFKIHNYAPLGAVFPKHLTHRTLYSL